METRALEELGLSPGESKCYVALLELGTTSTGALIKKTGLQKSAVYFCLDRLVDKGLASFFSRNNVKYFEAAKPARLLDYLERKEKELERQRADVRLMLPSLEGITPKGEERGARVFEGWEGMKSAFDDILETLKAGDEYLVFSVSPEGSKERFRRFIRKFHAKRVGRKIPLKIIVNEQIRSTVGRDRENEPRTEVKYAPPERLTPAAINIYANKILIALWTDVPTAFMIESKEVAESFRSYFYLLWKTLK